ncbi:macro domain-containing protein [Lysinibacillus fusiformis]|uniref:macro domain-containing protein n=1 Tax=Lysinibacillus fusiformis TaxID=28031 RepID=UPI00263A3FB3|nr:macro domain-containing protein [Lysinibacillus fusiformis]MDC6267319.1 macro domain-containing protein [Lysinibacillus sphaericus]MDN4968247.1 macro domain-containing protein [Lysinibacillus fusiformis]MDN4968421.1 macro domain-containing protein [Lysinibacillus fusiformis]
MKEIKGNVFELFETGEYDAICITTNGIIKKDGTAVMGAGVALEAKKRFKGIEVRLAKRLKEDGNRLCQLGISENGAIISFPTKHHFKDKSDINLIKDSSKQLMELIEEKGYSKVLITPMGCGNGGLQWDYVKKQHRKYTR